ncbi:MAG: precorrin-2 C(20)-methyltransferase [Tissierellia bacterium]|nr:precorrin-2 C(20)-methyltransferase [Tissierellia bacterium]
MKKLYAIGTGPGDPELLTLKAINRIKSSDIIFAPYNKGKNMALDTCKDFIDEDKLIFLEFPMGKVTKDIYRKNLDIIYENIPQDGSGVFLNIGDSTFYSTSMNMYRESNYEDLIIELVPGIPSFLAAGNILQEALANKGEKFLLVDEYSEKDLEAADSIAILKTFKNAYEIAKSLEENNFTWTYFLKISQDEQKIINNLEELKDMNEYMSLIIARRNG